MMMVSIPSIIVNLKSTGEGGLVAKGGWLLEKEEHHACSPANSSRPVAVPRRNWRVSLMPSV
jgi:hypothetical protein